MIGKNFQLRKALQILLASIVMIWMAGAIVAALYYNVHRKKECIANEGWLKGIIWCSSELGISRADEMVKGFLWPMDVLMNRTTNAVPPQPVRLSQQEFDGSTTGMAYLCWAIAAKRGRTDDASAIQAMLTSMSASNPDIRRDHSDYGVLATRALDRLEGSGKTDGFYLAECEQQIANIRASFVSPKQR